MHWPAPGWDREELKSTPAARERGRAAGVAGVEVVATRKGGVRI
jgi:hypothetical protein